MKLSSAVCALAALQTAVAVPAAERVSSPQKRGYVGLDFTKSYGSSFRDASENNRPQGQLYKRSDGYESIEITNQITFYSVSLNIGTPSQNITVLVDTGSSDLWVSNSNNPYCRSNYRAGSSASSGITSDDTINCQQYGTFDPTASNTWSSNNTAFKISYGDSTFASGVWGQDQLHLEDVNVTGLSFAVANRSNSTVGVLGIGMPGLEVTYGGSRTTKPYQYDNFPMVLKRNGAIEANAYSLYLSDIDDTHGTVLFGAVDHSKYVAPLYTIPLVNTLKANGFSSAVQFDVTLQGVGITTDGGETATTLTTTNIPALLDSGTTLTYLPEKIVSMIAKQVGATYSNAAGYYTMSCSSSLFNSTEIVFDFGGFHINATLENFIVQASARTCLLGIVPQSANSALLGDSFLSNAYVVYDLENKEVALAQARYDVDDEDIEVITSGASSIPGATNAPGYSNTWSTSVTSIGTTGNIFTVYQASVGASSTSGSAASTSTGSSRSSTRRSSASTTSKSSSSSKSNNKKNDAVRPDALGPVGMVSAVAFFMAMLL